MPNLILREHVLYTKYLEVSRLQGLINSTSLSKECSNKAVET